MNEFKHEWAARGKQFQTPDVYKSLLYKETKTINLARYFANTGELSVYFNIPATFTRDTVTIVDPDTGKKRVFQTWKVTEGQIHFGKRVAMLWSTESIDIDAFKQAVWEDRLEHYGHIVANAHSLIRKQKADLEKARKALVD